MSVQLASEHVTIQLRLYRDRQWFGWGELCRDTRRCIVTEGLNGWAIVSRYNDCIVIGAKARQAGGLCRNTRNCIVTGAKVWLAGVTIQSIVS